MDRSCIAGRLSLACLFAASISLIALGAPRGLAADDITGDWEIQMDRNGRVTYATLSISKKPDGALSGKWGSNELSDIKLDGNKLTFARTMRFGNQEFKTTYEGVLKDGALTGTLSSERGSFQANGARPKARKAVLGKWNLKYTIGDRDIEAVLDVSEGSGGAVDAKWTNNLGEHVVSNVKLEGNKLSLSRKTKIQDRELETTYEGTVDGHKITGTIKSPMGEIAANGSRVGADLVGKWELTTTTDQGTRTSLLTVFGDLSGRYELFGGEIPFKEVKLEGGDVAFSVETAFGDQQVTIEFKGKLEGSTLKGQATSPRGTRDVTGKKLEATPPPKPKATTL